MLFCYFYIFFPEIEFSHVFFLTKTSLFLLKEHSNSRAKRPVKTTGTGTVEFYNMKFSRNKMADFDFQGMKIRDV